MHNLPLILLKLFDTLQFFSKRIVHYQLSPKIVFSLQKHTNNTIKTFELNKKILVSKFFGINHDFYQP